MQRTEHVAEGSDVLVERHPAVGLRDVLPHELPEHLQAVLRPVGRAGERLELFGAEPPLEDAEVLPGGAPAGGKPGGTGSSHVLLEVWGERCRGG